MEAVYLGTLRAMILLITREESREEENEKLLIIRKGSMEQDRE